MANKTFRLCANRILEKSSDAPHVPTYSLIPLLLHRVFPVQRHCLLCRCHLPLHVLHPLTDFEPQTPMSIFFPQIWVRGYKSLTAHFQKFERNFCAHAPKSVMVPKSSCNGVLGKERNPPHNVWSFGQKPTVGIHWEQDCD